MMTVENTARGVYPVVTAPGHEVLEGIDEEFPFVLGYNYSKAKKDAEVVATICGDPFIAVGRYGEGKSAVVSTDCSPTLGSAGILRVEAL